MFNSRELYITSYNTSTLSESVMYSGFWFMQSELALYNQYILDLKTSINFDANNANTLQSLITSATTQTTTIPTDVQIPGYIDQSSNGSELSSLASIHPKLSN